MGLGQKNKLDIINLKVSIKQAKRMGMEFIYGWMAVIMLGNGEIILFMGMGFINGLKEKYNLS